jgi:hypothetical protein
MVKMDDIYLRAEEEYNPHYGVFTLAITLEAQKFSKSIVISVQANSQRL